MDGVDTAPFVDRRFGGRRYSSDPGTSPKNSPNIAE
jgi:hypothetical protein